MQYINDLAGIPTHMFGSKYIALGDNLKFKQESLAKLVKSVGRMESKRSKMGENLFNICNWFLGR